MSVNVPSPSRADARRRARSHRRARFRALLAGGVVLGLGATATLASWTDSEHARSTFTAGTFGIVGATNGTTFSKHPLASPATLEVTAVAGALRPGQSAYTPFALRTAPGSVAGTVLVDAPTATGSGAGVFRWGLRTVAGPNCTSATYAAGTVIVPDGSPLTTGQSTPAVALGASGSSTVHYCIALMLPSTVDNSAQGVTAQLTWAFRATSAVPTG